MAMTLEEGLSKLAADVAAISPAPVRKAVDALACSSAARATADALVYLCVGTSCTMFAAGFLTIVAGLACARGWYCTPAYVLSEIADYIAIPVLLLFAPALVLFFLRAAGCSREPAADAESLIVKDVEERPSGFSDFCLGLLWLLLLATLMGTISFVFYMYGYPEIFDLFGHVAFLVMFLCEAIVYGRAALALWRMNPGPSNMVAAE